MIRHVDDVQHHRTRAEIERDVVADPRPWVTVDVEHLHPTPLDAGHPNRLFRTAPVDHLAVRDEMGLRYDRGEVVHVGNVVDLGTAGRGLMTNVLS